MRWQYTLCIILTALLKQKMHELPIIVMNLNVRYTSWHLYYLQTFLCDIEQYNADYADTRVCLLKYE